MSASGPLKQVLYWILRTSETTSGGVCSAYAAHWVRQVIQSRMCIDLLRIVTIGMHLLGIKVAVNNVCFCVMCVCVCESEREREWIEDLIIHGQQMDVLNSRIVEHGCLSFESLQLKEWPEVILKCLVWFDACWMYEHGCKKLCAVSVCYGLVRALYKIVIYEKRRDSAQWFFSW
jgi:hypothetical protein